MAVPKWKIKGLSGKYAFRKTALIILLERINNLKRSIRYYLSYETAESLHNVRITLRRVRYNMELFYGLFDKKKFLNLYRLVENLQDKTGDVRDIYIMKQNILLFEKEDEIKIPDKLVVSIEEKEKLLIDGLKLEITGFLHSAELKIFMKILKKKEVL
ncbi:MAG: CHAD domain-containing protein [Ignavibacteriaceae bacterium]|nr:CHAD domain-containing protein [Ignavibacteriaceae bacterium]